MSALKFSGPVLPDGESRDLYVVDGRITFEPQPGAETAARGWIVPGLVDAHNHLGLEDHGAVEESEIEGQALADRDAGALLLRDCGSPADTRWVHERDDLPRLVRAGRHIARTRRYIRSYAHEVEPEQLSAYVAQEADAGDGWVKLVGDWISRETGDLAPSFPPESLAEAIAVAHEHGAKVTAHCFGHEVLQGLLDAGIDCIEHGTGLALDQVEQMAATGVALVPTVMQTDKFPEFAAQGREKFPAYAATMDELHARRREVLMSAHEAGVALYVGSDGGGAQRHGHLAGEVLAMAQMGLPAAEVLAAASWRAREWLGFEGLVEGASADFVVYDRDPAQDLTVLWEPTRVVLRGRVVA
ncbi:imidazolonepropionase-like amidohydrolase [Nocardioides marinisabuli]|uniref:Imidazolonepropionase-like amidohydrolase n=1 Tax=Nocardioides marinisabuli TaxID=419476 RepID=A0A7Y9JS83_9ACTN|nr:amidohydrolase family protein [Nocardioides marinisabuli]NYD58328.1 imidazolonepropionase-like amidohydrolase [Nocardioides marinisabuli]